MGFDVSRFVNGDLNQDLICSICSGVLQDPVWTQRCEHAFCRQCINTWLLHQSSCPNDRRELLQQHLTPIPRFMRNLLDKLELKCNFEPNGCTQILKLESLESHAVNCEFNPEKPILCRHGCGIVFKKSEIDTHNCLRDLRNMLMKEMEKREEIIEQKIQNITKTFTIKNRKLKSNIDKLQTEVTELREKFGPKRNTSVPTEPEECIVEPSPTCSTFTLNSSRDAPVIGRSVRSDGNIPNPYVLINPLSLSRLRNESSITIPSEETESTPDSAQSSNNNNQCLRLNVRRQPSMSNAMNASIYRLFRRRERRPRQMISHSFSNNDTNESSSQTETAVSPNYEGYSVMDFNSMGPMDYDGPGNDNSNNVSTSDDQQSRARMRQMLDEIDSD